MTNEANFATGAGGGQAGGSKLGSTEPRPVDAPGPANGGSVGTSPKRKPSEPESVGDVSPASSADLHRWYCEPWCVACDRFVTLPKGDGHRRGPCHASSATRPGLHTRDPRTKVEELEWDRVAWSLHEYCIEDEPAAALLVMGGVKAARSKDCSVEFGYDAESGLETFTIYVHDGPPCVGMAPTLPEAGAIAYHRMLDAEEG